MTMRSVTGSFSCGAQQILEYDDAEPFAAFDALVKLRDDATRPCPACEDGLPPDVVDTAPPDDCGDGWEEDVSRRGWQPGKEPR